ncbi:MAG: MotA/TolQ/ExbB proton channel family protein [Planctomycetaceae bacterium]
MRRQVLPLAFVIGLLGWQASSPAPLVAQPPAGNPVPVSPPAGADKTSSGNAADGNAVTRNLPTKLVDFVRALDWFLWPFVGCSLIVIWFTVERLVVLRRGRVIPMAFVLRFLKLLDEGDLTKDEALEICLKNDSPISHIFAHGVRKWDKPSVEVEQAIIDGGERQVSGLRSHLRVINGVATIAPMFGLLGTVWGMLESFGTVAEAGSLGKTAQLAAGIATALVTTAVGLAIAIPSLISYMYLSGRVDALVMEMDQLAQNVVHCISSEALADRASRPRKANSRSESATQKRA